MIQYASYLYEHDSTFIILLVTRLDVEEDPRLLAFQKCHKYFCGPVSTARTLYCYQYHGRLCDKFCEHKCLYLIDSCSFRMYAHNVILSYIIHYLPNVL